MHHASPLSTNVYYHIPPQVIRDQLLAAQVSAGLLEDERRGIRDEFQSSNLSLPRQWLSGLKDPFGIKAYFRSIEPSNEEEVS
jgi:hypothetical protein